MATTSAQLDEFASRVEMMTTWTPDVTAELMDLIREPAMSIKGQLIPPNDRTRAMDDVYRCKPGGWKRAEQELVGGPFAVASFMLWTQEPGEAYMGLKAEIGNQRQCRTLLLAMIAATARTWAYIMRGVGR